MLVLFSHFGYNEINIHTWLHWQMWTDFQNFQPYDSEGNVLCTVITRKPSCLTNPRDAV